MLVIPAIDLKDGKCVRLTRGRAEECTVYSDDPVGTAKQWEKMGAELLHVVDLDGALVGEPKNMGSIESIIDSIRVPVEVGGGIRSDEVLEKYLEIGAQRVVLGTRAHQEPAFVRNACRTWRNRIVLGVDVSEGHVAVKGWTSVTREKAVDFAQSFEDYGIAAVIYTDIKRDGTLAGINFDGVEEFAGKVDIPVIASGGAASLNDIIEIKKREKAGIVGVIVGKALYTGDIDLKKAIAIGLGK